MLRLNFPSYLHTRIRIDFALQSPDAGVAPVLVFILVVGQYGSSALDPKARLDKSVISKRQPGDHEDGEILYSTLYKASPQLFRTYHLKKKVSKIDCLVYINNLAIKVILKPLGLSTYKDTIVFLDRVSGNN
jgi:hypothetical protein